MPGLRVGFEMEERVEDSGAHRVVAAKLLLATFGSGAAPVAAGETKACVLQFTGRCLENAREESDAAFEPFAELNGTMSVVGTRPSFAFLPTSALTPLKPNANEGTTRTIQLDFDAATFRAAPSASSELRTLRFPDPPDPNVVFRHFELGVVLLVDGAEASGIDVNGVLDVPLGPPTTGLVLEWPAELDEVVPPSLTFVAKQGDVERVVRWELGVVSEGRRRFLFHGIEGTAPVDLTAVFEGRTAVLWEAQNVADPASPPAWKTTLEAEIGRIYPSTNGEFKNRSTLASNDVARPIEASSLFV